MSYTIEEHNSQVIGARRIGDTPAGYLDWLLTDSRSLKFSRRNTVFCLAYKAE